MVQFPDSKILVLMALVCSGCVKPLPADAPSITIATGGVKGSYYAMGRQLCRTIETARLAACEARTTSGFKESLKRLDDGKVDFAIAPSYAVYNARRGKDPFGKDGPYGDLRVVMALSFEVLTVIVRPDSGIRDFADLKHRRVGTPGGISLGLLKDLAASSQWQASDIRNWKKLSFDDPVLSLCKRDIDALALVVGDPSNYTKRAVSRCDGEIIAIEGAFAVKAIKRIPTLVPVEIDGEEWYRHEEATPSLAFPTLLVTDKSSDPTFIQTLSKSLVDRAEELQARYPHFRGFSGGSAVQLRNFAPIHPGAQTYFKNSGLRE